VILLQLSGVEKSFGEDVILRDVDLTLQNGERVGLVGANGSGKSTLLRIAGGQWQADSGSIDKPEDVRVGYLPQSARVSGTLPLLAEMERVFQGQPETEPYEYKIRIALHGVGLPEAMWNQSTESLSGGEKCRAALARVLLSEPDVLLLDEPTNHLDVTGREWLEQYLARFAGAVVLVAHDRMLLDRATNRTAFLLGKTLKLFKGNYNRSREQWQAERERMERAYERQREEILRQEDFIRRNIAGQKTKQAQSRRRMLSKLNRLQRPEQEGTAPKVGWAHAGRSRAEVIRLESCSVGYGQTTLATARSLILHRGDKIGVVGPNGCGKSTLVRTLLGQAAPLDGTVQTASNTRISYFQQEVTPVEADVSVEQHFWNSVPHWQIGQVRSHLARFLFRRDEVEKSVRGLSGGEMRRLELARLTVTPAHLLILDEPTNHLDLMAQEAVEDALSSFEGSILLVSHDRQLLDSVCAKLWVFEAGNIDAFLGNYQRYAEARAQQREAESEARQKAKRSRRREKPPDPKAILRRLKRQVAEAEDQIARLESDLDEIESEGRDPKTATNWERLNFLTTEKRKKTRELNRWLAAWEEASGKLHELEPDTPESSPES
jgi:ATP-binding cassette subfamily F protein 3